MTKKVFKKLIFLSIIMLISVTLIKLNYPKVYYAEDFNMITLKSDCDKNNNDIDDYTDILIGARQDALDRPKYKSAYYAGGYPPIDEGVCSDLVWRAFKNAGYSLKDLIDQDIKENEDLYPGLDNKPDPNIDFRRVRNLKVFFDRHAEVLTLDYNEIAAWQPGDIVIFGNNYNHIAIISDKRNKDGIPYIIHNAGQLNREEDALIKWQKKINITGHYRWNKSGK